MGARPQEGADRGQQDDGGEDERQGVDEPLAGGRQGVVVARPGAQRAGQGRVDRQQQSRPPRGGGGREDRGDDRRGHQVDQDAGVVRAGHQPGRQAAGQARGAHPDGDDEGRHQQPDRVVSEAGEHLVRAQGAGEDQGGGGAQGDVGVVHAREGPGPHRGDEDDQGECAGDRQAPLAAARAPGGHPDRRAQARGEDGGDDASPRQALGRGRLVVPSQGERQGLAHGGRVGLEGAGGGSRGGHEPASSPESPCVRSSWATAGSPVVT